MTAIHHLHKRKRIHQKHEKYPAESTWKRLLDKLVYVAGIMGPLLTIPQIFKIFMNQDATSISLISWVSYFFGAIVLLMYSVSHKEKPLIIMYSLWVIAHSVVIVGILLYGGGGLL
jgi:uncharacterized protein with PQ loop repeat